MNNHPEFFNNRPMIGDLEIFESTVSTVRGGTTDPNDFINTNVLLLTIWCVSLHHHTKGKVQQVFHPCT